MKVHYERIPLRRQDGGEVDPYDPLSASAGIAPAGTPTVDQIPWNQPSWLEQADEQSRRDQEAYEREGIPGLLRDTSTTQDLASGFGGGAGIAGTTKAVGARVASAPPLYSAVEEAVANAKSPQAPAPQWLGMIRNTPGVKPEELEHLGVEDFLKNQKGPVSKEALQEHIAGNKVDVQEVMKGAPRVEEPAILAKRFYNDHNPGYSWDDLTPERQQEWIRSAQEHQQQGYSTESPTKFQQYTLPGGENYRELLLTLPEKSGEVGPRGWGDTAGGTFDTANFRSSHWDEPNVLAHVRFDDRNIGGDKTLHMAEVQSDWHQAGRRQGYREPIPAAERPAAIERLHALEEQLGAMWSRRDTGEYAALQVEADILRSRIVGTSGVPDAPFKTTWPELALKRMIRYAAEHGYDRISWDTGATNAERYDLSRHVKEIEYIKQHDGTYKLGIADKDGRGVDLPKETYKPEELPDIVGKEVADKIVSGEGTRYRGHEGMTLSGLDLKVGGEGMKGFYDRMLPNVTNKLVKKYGARVEQSSLYEGSPEAWEPFKIIDGQWGLRNKKDGYESSLTYPTKEAAHASLYEGKQSPVHSLAITPELRDQALHRGFPLFSEGMPIPPHDTPKRQQDEQPQFAKGGAVTLTDEDRAALVNWYHGLVEDRAYNGRLHYSPVPVRNMPLPGSFRVGKDIIAKLGDGDLQTGGFILQQMFGIEDDPEDPTVVHPHVLRILGNGSLAAGRRVLERFVAQVRRGARDSVVLEHDGREPDGGHHGWSVAR